MIMVNAGLYEMTPLVGNLLYLHLLTPGGDNWVLAPGLWVQWVGRGQESLASPLQESTSTSSSSSRTQRLGHSGVLWVALTGTLFLGFMDRGTEGHGAQKSALNMF